MSSEKFAKYGKIWRNYFIQCAGCGLEVRLVAGTLRQAEREVRARGWRRGTNLRWRCGACTGGCK